MERTKARWRSRAAVAGLPAPVAAEALSPWRRSSDIEKLCAGELDILVVGGGVVGAGAALDATTRGFATGLIEARDWASGTSSRSTKLVHGGLRYLQMLDFRLVREALKERDLLLRRLAPHLVRPVPVLYPLRNYFFERVYVGAGVALYDLLGWSIGGSRELPRHRHLSKRSTLEATPGLRATAVTGAVRYYDAQVDDARLVLELVRTAVSYGATAQNRMRLTGFLRAGSRVSGARVTDTETGQEHEVRARVTVVATGAWTEETEALALEGNGALVRPSKGTHLVVPAAAIESSTGLILRTKRSVLFVLPWGPHWLIGTTDTDWPYDKDNPLATAADIEYLLGEINSVLDRPVRRSDIEAVFAGLRPLVAGVGVVRGPGDMRRGDGASADVATTKLSREHAVTSPVPGLVVVSGGKYTTYRVMAVDAVDTAVRFLGLSTDLPSQTERIPLLGARNFADLWEGREEVVRASRLSLATIEHLLRRYGALAREVLSLIDDDASLAQPLEGAEDYLRAEVSYAVSHEGARHVEDVLMRRTRAAMENRGVARASSRAAAELIAPLLGWDQSQVQAEVEDYAALAALEEKASWAPSDAEAAALAANALPGV